jgi:rod shape-determining protein MreC
MEYSPPPLFKQGPSALARLIFFVLLAIALLISDARFSTLEMVRGVLGAGLYPLQRAALVPRDIFMGAADLAVTSATLRSENRKLADKNLQLSVKAGEIQYDTRDPFTQKVVISKGSQQGIQDGAPVVNEDGVIGQVTRVFPLQSEVTLLTDKDQAVPVQISRTGLRSVIYGTPKGDTLDLRFVPISADVQAGDELVTSGLDGVYPPGLAVAKVLRVDKQADTAFARVVCVPIAAVRGARELLVLHYNVNVPPNPIELEAAAAAKEAKENKGKKKPAKAAAASGASGASAAVAASAPASAPASASAPAAEKPAAPKAASGAAVKRSKKAHMPKPASSGAVR